MSYSGLFMILAWRDLIFSCFNPLMEFHQNLQKINLKNQCAKTITIFDHKYQEYL
jgi:hypothetical protein